MNLTGQAPHKKGQKRRRARPNDDAFLAWLRTQPSAIDGAMDVDRDTGARRCDPCHYRTAANAGTSKKPLWSAIPMTRKQHLLQHQIGQYSFRPRSWWEEKVEYYKLKYHENACGSGHLL